MPKCDRLPRNYFIVFVLSTLSVAGCGKGGLPTYPIQGTLKYQGSEDTIPGAGLELRANVKHEKYGRAIVSGVVREDGTITLATVQKGDGAPAGEYQIILKEPPIPLDWDVDEHGGVPPAKIPQKYKSYSTSELAIEVRPDGENRLDIQIEKPDR